jgi:hypothetical protein
MPRTKQEETSVWRRDLSLREGHADSYELVAYGSSETAGLRADPEGLTDESTGSDDDYFSGAPS